MTGPSFVLSNIVLGVPLSLNSLFASRHIEVDAGFGKGRFLLARAAAYPNRGYLGIEKKHFRVLGVDRKLRKDGIQNVRLLEMEISYAVQELLPPDSVSSFFIFFPDPWPKRRHSGRRLITETFLQAVNRVLMLGGELHIATDDVEYGLHIDALLKRISELDRLKPFEFPEDQKTDFELLFTKLNKPISRFFCIKAR